MLPTIRGCQLQWFMRLLVACSVGCSLVLFFMTTRLDNFGNHKNKLYTSARHQSVKILNGLDGEERHTFSAASVDELEQSVNKLKEELAYSQNALHEIEQNKDMKSRVDCRQGYNIARCQVLHIAIVCAGFKDSRRVVTLIKSILFYRKHPLHFHFISDSSAQLALKKLFDTWLLQQVLVTFYDTEKSKPFIDWIPNRHYSGIYGLMKLTLTELLPDSLDRTIVLDTDVFFLADIAELWSQFHNFTKRQAVGLVENQSKWYLGNLFKNYKPWPALGRGFNTGVILLDLRKLRRLKWAHLWRLTAEKELMNLLHTHLADQDIINAVIKDNPFLVYKMPCVWNIQFSDNTQSEKCYADVTDLKVIHWNSPKKSSVAHKHVEYFRNMYQTFLQYDGNLLRRELFFCEIGTDEHNADNKDVLSVDDESCHEYNAELQLVRRVHLFYLDFVYESTKYDVTLIAHSSMDRLQIIETLLTHWEGPVSISLYASDAEAQQFLRYSQKSPLLSKRTNVGIHLVYKDGDFYPVNYLRNIALQQANTPYVFLCDIDFLPVPGTYERLKRIASGRNMTRKAVVVPAFETYKYKLEFPRSKAELLSAIDQGIVSKFRNNVWPQGHAPTNFEKWKSSSQNYKIEWKPDFEPYVMIKRDHAPLYDQRFVGFGWNKVSHIMALHALKYEFVVAAAVFIIHMPHAPSFDLVNYRLNTQYRKCLDILKKKFSKELEAKYSIKFN
eukprot:gene17939-19730_t